MRHTDADLPMLYGGRLRYFADLSVDRETCLDYRGHMDDQNTYWPAENIETFCQILTGQRRWNDHRGMARWGFLAIYVHDDGSGFTTEAFHANVFRFAFSRRRDAKAFRLRFT